MTERKFYTNTITIDILTEDKTLDSDDLDDIVNRITYGDAVAGELNITSVEISSKVAADKLLQFGSDPEFFRLDDEGETLP